MSPCAIRVIVCEPDSETRTHLKTFIDNDPILTLSAEAGNWGACETALLDFVPDLLLVRSELIPRDWVIPRDQEGSLPVVIALREAASSPGVGAHDCNVLRMPAEPDAVRECLNQAVKDTYDCKVRQLRFLVDRYVEALKLTSRYGATVTGERDGQMVQLNPEKIISIVAARKGGSIHTRSGPFLLREPLRVLAAKLDPRIFVRIHRSVIINRFYLDDSVPVTNKSSVVVMADGSKRPVGRNYRSALLHAATCQGQAPASGERRISRL
jgi:two-component system, LytTR family, response regulator